MESPQVVRLKLGSDTLMIQNTSSLAEDNNCEIDGVRPYNGRLAVVELVGATLTDIGLSHVGRDWVG